MPRKVNQEIQSYLFGKCSFRLCLKVTYEIFRSEDMDLLPIGRIGDSLTNQKYSGPLFLPIFRLDS